MAVETDQRRYISIGSFGICQIYRERKNVWRCFISFSDFVFSEFNFFEIFIFLIFLVLLFRIYSVPDFYFPDSLTYSHNTSNQSINDLTLFSSPTVINNQDSSNSKIFQPRVKGAGHCRDNSKANVTL
jgi:hypothetical protein